MIKIKKKLIITNKSKKNNNNYQKMKKLLLTFSFFLLSLSQLQLYKDPSNTYGNFTLTSQTYQLYSKIIFILLDIFY